MQHDEILEMVITELTERGYKQQRNENPEVDDLVLRRIELSQQVKECVSSLSQEAQDTLEEYHNTMDILSGHQIKYLYLQGAKDCVSLLQELGVIR
jgi:rubrerythrin